MPGPTARGLPQLVVKIIRNDYAPIPSHFSRPFAALIASMLRADPVGPAIARHATARLVSATSVSAVSLPATSAPRHLPPRYCSPRHRHVSARSNQRHVIFLARSRR